MTAIDNLLSAIRKHEAPKGYGQICYFAEAVLRKRRLKIPDVSKMTLGAIQSAQQFWVRLGAKSSAAGGYQFIKNTLRDTIKSMGLSLDLIWDSKLQDQMAIYLLKKRGLNSYLEGSISREAFANNLAAEWASLPMVTGPKKGKSKYAGDGMNKSFHSVASILSLVDAVKAEHHVKLKG